MTSGTERYRIPIPEFLLGVETVDATAARRLYRADLQQALQSAGGKTRKRTYRAMVRAVTEYRGAELEAPDEQVFVWSDLHLGHANIIEYQGRPFLNVEDMNAQLWGQWETVVQPDSVLVLVGDVAMGAAIDATTWERVKRSPGRHKHLVIGNHDLTGLGEVRAAGFDDIWSVMTSGGTPPLIWTHYPLREVPEGHVNIHGHEHATPPPRSRHINVSVEQLYYEPVSLARLRRLAQLLVAEIHPPGTSTIERIESLERAEA